MVDPDPECIFSGKASTELQMLVTRWFKGLIDNLKLVRSVNPGIIHPKVSKIFKSQIAKK